MEAPLTSRFILTVAVLSAQGAERTIDAAEQRALQSALSVSIAVVDTTGNLLAFRRMDGAPVASIAISVAQATSAVRSRVASKLLQDRVDGGQPSLLAMPGVTALQGGVPITVDGAVVGAIGVSGAQGPEDVEVARAGAFSIQSIE